MTPGSWRRAWIAGVTLGIEAVTVAMRFGAGLRSSSDTAWLAQFTWGWRIHHGYIGLLLLLAFWLWPGGWRVREAGIIIGASLLLSDLIHHFLVLWPLTGSPQFDLRYPDPGR